MVVFSIFAIAITPTELSPYAVEMEKISVPARRRDKLAHATKTFFTTTTSDTLETEASVDECFAVLFVLSVVC